MGIFKKNKPLFDSTSTAHTSNSYQLQGRAIVCTHCGHNQFDQATALLNTPGMTFFGLDWANRSATLLSCKQCGRIEWFLRQPEELV